MEDRRQIAHIHIPKCGGTTITSYLRRILGPDQVAHFGRREETAEFTRTPRQDFDRRRSVGGHIPYPQLFSKFGDSRLYFTTIRDPFDLFVSFYQDVSTRESHPLKNDAMRMSHLEFLDHVSSANLLPPQIYYFTQNNALDEALQLVSAWAIHVEILPRLNGFLNELAAYLGARHRALPHANQSKKLDLKDEDLLRAAVKRHYAIDYALYDLVGSTPRRTLERAPPR